MSDVLTFGAWLRRRRKALDLTQAALAQRVGCSLGSIRKCETISNRGLRRLLKWNVCSGYRRIPALEGCP